jgi:large subunit ribosomal protein L4
MAKAKLYSAQGAFSKEIELPETHFDDEVSRGSIYYTVKAYLANQRQGTHMAKNRALVSGTTKKSFKQKGTGRARKGDEKSPLFVRGGKAHPPMPRNYVQKVNKKVKAKALLSALTVKGQSGQVHVFEGLSFETPKTIEFDNVMTTAGLASNKVLVLVSPEDSNVYLSAKNLTYARVMRVNDVNTYELLRANAVVITKSALATLTTKEEN